MPERDAYELVDFGDGRKLERFGTYVVDRPAPAAERAPQAFPELWRQAQARYDREGGWQALPPLDAPWPVQFGTLVLELRLTDSGQLGVFPEQAANWQWIGEQVRAAGPIEVLNLFGYTGASTLAAAAAGARVAHVDGAASAVAWARHNAELSGLSQAPIRWITEDATRFVRRELKRGNGYDAVILDPPAYGQGPGGGRFKLEDDLPELLSLCLRLCAGRERFLLLTCHTEPLGRPDRLVEFAREHGAPWKRGILRGEEMLLTTAAGRALHSGAAVRLSGATK